MKLVPTILSGGSGARLWPVSREKQPKPFIKLPDGRSLLQKTFLRASQIVGAEEILVITNKAFLLETQRAGLNIGALPQSFIVEPFGRNTAAAVAIASLEVARRHGEDCLILIQSADQLITKSQAFAEAVSTAVDLAAGGAIVTFGIRPDYPETGFGYIEAEGHRVRSFVEKPDLETAQRYLATGRYLWNAGMFCFSAGRMLAEMREICPALLDCVITAYDSSQRGVWNNAPRLDLPEDAFAKVPDISIDYAVIEKSKHVAVVPCDIGWSDIGSWSSMRQIYEPDSEGNRTVGQVLSHDSQNSFVLAGDSPRVIGLVGVKDLIVVDTPDALLVADQGRAQDVKHIYAQLKQHGNPAYQEHRTVLRPWGSYTVLEEYPSFKIKRIEVKPNASLSLQLHHHRSEHWVVVSGTAKVTNGDHVSLIHANESTYIPAGQKHRLENPGKIDLVIIEVQSGEYLGEDDIIRFGDSYDHMTETAE